MIPLSPLAPRMNQNTTTFQTDEIAPTKDSEKLYAISRETIEKSEFLFDEEKKKLPSDLPISTEMRERPEIRQKRQRIRISVDLSSCPHNNKPQYDLESTYKSLNQDYNIGVVKLILSNMIDDAQTLRELTHIKKTFKQLIEQFNTHFKERLNDLDLKLIRNQEKE